nr:MAG TPA: hypothetical protein [Caudoviricetes sp.]
MPFVCRQSKKLRNYWEFLRLNYLNYKSAWGIYKIYIFDMYQFCRMSKKQS